MKKEQGYIPNVEEMKLAEEMMTQEQKELSKERKQRVIEGIVREEVFKEVTKSARQTIEEGFRKIMRSEYIDESFIDSMVHEYKKLREYALMEKYSCDENEKNDWSVKLHDRSAPFDSLFKGGRFPFPKEDKASVSIQRRIESLDPGLIKRYEDSIKEVGVALKKGNDTDLVKALEQYDFAVKEKDEVNISPSRVSDLRIKKAKEFFRKWSNGDIIGFGQSIDEGVIADVNTYSPAEEEKTHLVESLLHGSCFSVLRRDGSWFCPDCDHISKW